MNFNKLARYLYTSGNDDSYESVMKNIRTYSSLAFIALVIFNGFVWTTIFDNYKSFHQETLVNLKEDNQKLNNLVSEHNLEGMDVVVTMYHPVSYQTDSTPNILADGTRIRVHKASEYRYIAVSRNLLKRWGGWLDYGDFILLKGTDGKDGMYQVKDTMNARFVNRIDILESPGTKRYKFDIAQISRVPDDTFVSYNNK